MYRRWIGMILLGVLIVGVTPGLRTSARSNRAPRPADKLPADLEFVALSGSSFISLRSGELLDAAPMKVVPASLKRELERMQKDAQKFLGLAVADIERVSFVMPSSTRGEPVVVVRTRKAYDQDAVVKKTLGPNAVPIKLGDRAGFTQKERNGMSLCALDDRSFALGRDRGMKEAMKRADAKVTERPHGLAIEWAAANHQVVIGSTAEPLLYLIASEDKSAESAPAEVRPVPIEKNRVGPKRPEGKQVDPIEPKPDRVKDKPSRRGFAVQVEEKPIAPPQERIEERRPELDLNEILAQLPVEALPFKPLLQAKSIAVAVDLGTESKASWRFTFADAETAADGETSARAVFYVVRELLGRIPRETNMPPDSVRKILPTIEGVHTALKSTKIERHGAMVEGSLVLKTDEKAVGPLFAEMEKAAAGVEALNNFKQIGLAMHSYHNDYGALPNAAICDKASKPLLSWRVAILPYIGEAALYRQFKLDEPWDSANNIKLLDKMPSQFAISSRAAKGKGETFVQVFTGPGTAFDLALARPGEPSLGIRLTDITDGTTYTLMAVEAAESVPWTKPVDLPYDAKKPLPKLGGARPDRFFAVYFDGHVGSIRTKLDEAILRALITPNGGEVVGPYEDDEPGRDRPIRRPVRIEGNRPARPPEVKPDLPPERKP